MIWTVRDFIALGYLALATASGKAVGEYMDAYVDTSYKLADSVLKRRKI